MIGTIASLPVQQPLHDEATKIKLELTFRADLFRHSPRLYGYCQFRSLCKNVPNVHYDAAKDEIAEMDALRNLEEI